MSLESPPALHTTICPDSSSEQTSSGKEEDVSLQLEENLPARIAVTVTTFSLNETEGADSQETESPATGYMPEKIPQRLEKTSSTEKASKRSGSEGVDSNDLDTIKMDEPVVMRTRRSSKLQNPSKAKRAKNISGRLRTETEGESLLNSYSKTSSNKTSSLK